VISNNIVNYKQNKLTKHYLKSDDFVLMLIYVKTDMFCDSN